MTIQLSENKKKKRTREEKNKLAARIVAGIMAFLMVAGMAYYTILMLASAVGAETTAAGTQIIDTSSLKDSEDVLISVGLMYGSNLTTGFQTTTSDGYTIGVQQLTGDKEFDEIWDLDETAISSTADANLSKNGLTYLIASSRNETAVGGYHIEVNCSDLDREELEDLIDEKEDDIEAEDLYIIPAYIAGEYALRIGDFSSVSSAEDYIGAVEDIFGRYDVYTVSPTETAVSVIDPYEARILFEFDCGGEGEELGLKAHRDQNGNTYIMTPATNVYDGVFCFKRYHNGDVDGVSLINILPLEAYIAGVLPYETSNSWPLETLKAFAVTVRSYTLTHINEHATYHFDLCNTTDCQVYKGAGRINDRVMEAVLGTAGKVLTYNGDIVTAYYSSSVGGVSVSAQDAWGGKNDIPYLQAVETPWENYMVHNNAFWMAEISPTALLDRLHTAGYEQLRDAVENVEIIQLAKNSTYVKTLRITDIHGTSVDINYTDNVRTSLTPYVKSANFVVGRGEVEYTENVIVTYTEEAEPEEEIRDEEIQEESFDKDYGYINLEDAYVMTSESLEKNTSERTASIITGSGTVEHKKRDIFVMARNNAASYLGEEYLIYIEEEKEPEESHNVEIVTDKTTSEVIYKIAHAEDEDNFIFVGKGWGHGVGMSQYGARDMAEQGYKADEILMAYFVDTKIVAYEKSNNFKN